MQAIHLSNGRLSAKIIPFGASLVDLRLSEWAHPLILGFPNIEDYSQTNHYAGAVIGRHANRIAGGQAKLDGQWVDLPRNGGNYHLHGGETGLARQLWRASEISPTRLRLEVVSPSGHEGYPGNCAVSAIYEIIEPATLRLTLIAETDATTWVNLCHHPYFNFAGGPDIFDHVLSINADRYLPTDEDGIPDGDIRSVKDSPFDFSKPRPVGTQRIDPGFNHNFCLADKARQDPDLAATLSVPGGPHMELWSTQCGLHLYDGYKLPKDLVTSYGRKTAPNMGICLEAQNWPDSPSHPHFPPAELHPMQTYRQITDYRFG